jgi:hypothetical protein
MGFLLKGSGEGDAGALTGDAGAIEAVGALDLFEHAGLIAGATV